MGTNKTIPGLASFRLDIKSFGIVNYASQAVSDGDGDRCPLRYYRKGTDIGADGEPLEILLGPTVTKLERCRTIRWGI